MIQQLHLGFAIHRRSGRFSPMIVPLLALAATVLSLSGKSGYAIFIGAMALYGHISLNYMYQQQQEKTKHLLTKMAALLPIDGQADYSNILPLPVAIPGKLRRLMRNVRRAQGDLMFSVAMLEQAAVSTSKGASEHQKHLDSVAIAAEECAQTAWSIRNLASQLIDCKRPLPQCPARNVNETRREAAPAQNEASSDFPDADKFTMLQHALDEHAAAIRSLSEELLKNCSTASQHSEQASRLRSIAGHLAHLCNSEILSLNRAKPIEARAS